MATRILIAGGYGFVGGTIARLVREIDKNIELVLGGRNPERGAALARDLGKTSTAYLDVEKAPDLSGLGPLDLIISALYDPANALVNFAITHGVAHIGITNKAEDVAPIAFAALRSPPKRPIVLLGHSMAGVATILTLKAVDHFSRVDSLEIAGLFDPLDTLGAMTAGDAEMLISRALVREKGKWAWVDGTQHARQVRLTDDSVVEGYPTGLLDVPSLASITGAANVRLDVLQGDSLGTRTGGSASSDVYIDIAGVLRSGAPVKQRTIVSDPKGLAHLTALGVLVATERVLGLNGQSQAPGGLFLPETLLVPDTAITRLERFGVAIRWQNG